MNDGIDDANFLTSETTKILLVAEVWAKTIEYLGLWKSGPRPSPNDLDAREKIIDLWGKQLPLVQSVYRNGLTKQQQAQNPNAEHNAVFNAMPQLRSQHPEDPRLQYLCNKLLDVVRWEIAHDAEALYSECKRHVHKVVVSQPMDALPSHTE